MLCGLENWLPGVFSPDMTPSSKLHWTRASTRCHPKHKQGESPSSLKLTARWGRRASETTFSSIDKGHGGGVRSVQRAGSQ